MIFITKPAKIPAILLKSGKDSCKAICDKYEIGKKDYQNGSKKFEYAIKSSIYGGTTVKSVLKKAQHEKCCFCEKKQRDEYGAVEHYRPKQAYKAKRKDKLIKPGYYWLGYEWENLFFVCGPCNTSKGNIFPIVDESKRASNHKKKLKSEDPYLLNPCGTRNPRKHINFVNQFIVGLTDCGDETIEICHLDRDSLNNEREKLINDIDARLIILDKKNNHHVNEVKKAEDFIKNAISPTGEYSSMVIDYLNSKGVILY